MPDKPFISKITCVKPVSGKYGNVYGQLYDRKIYDYEALQEY